MDYFASCRVFRVQILLHPHLVVGNDRVRRIQNDGRRTIILRHDDVLVCFVIDKHLRSCASPFIDALVRVSHNEQVLILVAEDGKDVPFPRRTVLDFIHHHILESALPLLSGNSKGAQDIVCKVQKIAEIQ